MRMKRVLLATSALAALSCTQSAQADGMYVSVFGGANWHQDISRRLATNPTDFIDVNADRQTGFVIGASVGAGLDNWAKGLRSEFEVSYRRQDVDGDLFSTQGGSHTHTATFAANQSTFAVMANIWYDIDVGWKIKPYVGGGVGWARSRWEMGTDGGEAGSTTNDNSGFAWQLGLGFNYEVGSGVDVGLGYRYFEGPRNATSFEVSHQTYDTVLDNQNHEVMVNLTIETN